VTIISNSNLMSDVAKTIGNLSVKESGIMLEAAYVRSGPRLADDSHWFSVSWDPTMGRVLSNAACRMG